MSTLTDASLTLFLALAKDACNWNGEPLLDISKEQRGNLTHLKRAKLLTTFESDGCQWVQFTDAGVAFAAQHGVTITR